MRAVKIYDLFQFISNPCVYHYFLSLTWENTWKLMLKTHKNHIIPWVTWNFLRVLLMDLYLSLQFLWVMIMRRKISKHTKDFFHKKCKFEHPVLWSYMQKKTQTTRNNKGAAKLKPWHTKYLQKRLAKIQIQPNIVIYFYVRNLRLAEMKSAGTFLFFRL